MYIVILTNEKEIKYHSAWANLEKAQKTSENLNQSQQLTQLYPKISIIKSSCNYRNGQKFFD